MSHRHDYSLVAVKRAWVPDSVFSFFGYYGLRIPTWVWPVWWILTRKPTATERETFR